MPNLPRKFPICFWSLSVGLPEKSRAQSLCGMAKVILLWTGLAFTTVDTNFPFLYPGTQAWYKEEARVRLWGTPWISASTRWLNPSWNDLQVSHQGTRMGFFSSGYMLSTQFNCFSNSTQRSFLKAYIYPEKFCLPPKVKGMIGNGTQKEGCTQERGKVNKNFLKIKAEFQLKEKWRDMTCFS